jgi:hypothetical protein
VLKIRNVLIASIWLLVLGAAIAACNGPSSSGSAAITYPPEWPDKRIKAPGGSRPSNTPTLRSLSETRATVINRVENGIRFCAIGFKNDIGANAVIDDFKRQMIDAGYHENPGYEEVWLDYVSDEGIFFFLRAEPDGTSFTLGCQCLAGLE